MGFDVERSVPSRKQLGRVLRKLPNAAAQFLLDGMVTALRQELPLEVDFGDAISLDTKHILALVRENNPKEYIKGRYDKTKQPKVDPDCRLGCKRKQNRGAGEGTGGESGSSAPAPAAAGAMPTPNSEPVPASKTEVGEYYWATPPGW